ELLDLAVRIHIIWKVRLEERDKELSSDHLEDTELPSSRKPSIKYSTPEVPATLLNVTNLWKQT
ncbi:Hypothetical predicted protein, partial [Pelobates cultripes]